MNRHRCHSWVSIWCFTWRVHCLSIFSFSSQGWMLGVFKPAGWQAISLMLIIHFFIPNMSSLLFYEFSHSLRGLVID